MQKKQYTNHLINENSPYLLQHAHQPVDWYPWGDKALTKAKTENKLILVSVGYSACHWCHVMAKESFEDEIIARIMNANFVCIKVDREERPDIDQIYMDAVQLLTNAGGWPLNCFALPDGRPVYGGTYFPPSQWREILEKLADVYYEDPAKTENYANELTRGVKSLDIIKTKGQEQTYKEKDIKNLFQHIGKFLDNKKGGLKRAPKFPLPNLNLFLLQYYFYSNSRLAKEHLQLNLAKMANGGIYDQLGGGFARYSVDEDWKEPHFEKMLYDNAQLISLYSQAYKQFNDSTHKAVVIQSIQFIKNELTHPKGVFYSALDADSEGQEGKFYVWKKNEIDEILKNDSKIFCRYYSVTRDGNWKKGQNILWKQEKAETIAADFDISGNELKEIVNKSKQKLLKERNKRVRPGLDDKVLTAWNALMIKALCEAFQALGNNQYLEMAEKTANFLLKNQLQSNGNLKRVFKNSLASIDGFLDDYAFFIQALIVLYQTTLEERWLHQAYQLNEYTLAHFFDKKSGMFFYTDDVAAKQLISRKMETRDTVIPSSNSVMAENLYLLSMYVEKTDYYQKALQMMHNMYNHIFQYHTYSANWLMLMLRIVYPQFEVSITGKNPEKELKKFISSFMPDVIISGTRSKSDLPLLINRAAKDKTQFFVCYKKTCLQPVETAQEAWQSIQNKRKS